MELDLLTEMLLVTAFALGLLFGLLRVRRRVLAEDAALTARLTQLARAREENQRRFCGAPPLDHRPLTGAWLDEIAAAEKPWPPSSPPRPAPPRFGDHRRRSHLTTVR